MPGSTTVTDLHDAVRRLVALYQRLKNDKMMQALAWEDMLRLTIPQKAAVLRPAAPDFSPFDEIFDASGMLAAEEFASNLYAEATPLNRRSFLLTAAPGSRAAEDRTYTASLQDRTERLHAALAVSNFETEIHSVYQDLTLGTACIVPARSDDKPFDFSARSLGEYCFTEQDGRPDSVFVERQLTPLEAAEKWGLEKLPDALRQEIRELSASAYTKHSPYLNVIRRNGRYDPAVLTVDGYPYESLWIDLSGTDRSLLKREGMRRQRYVIARFWKAAGLPWGYGPTQMAYGPIRCLDKTMEIVLKYAAKVLDPPSIWPSDAAFWPQSTEPGAILMGQMGAMDRGRPEYLELQGDHRVGQFLFEYLGGQIARAYLVHVFQMLRDNKQRTAREVAAILEKDYRLAIPIFARLRSELFGPLVRNCLELLTEFELGIRGWRYGGQLLPEYEYELEMITPLGLAIKYAELQNLSDLAVLMQPLAGVKPDVWDNYSLDDIARGIGDNMGIPQRWKVGQREVRRIREARRQIMAQREMMEQIKLAGQAASGLGKKVDPDSILAGAAA